MTKAELEKHISLVGLSNDELINNLSDRKKKELEFHDNYRNKNLVHSETNLINDSYGNKRFYSTVKSSSDYVINWIQNNCKDKVFLDFACGNGHNALLAARSGAKISIGIDISEESIKNAKNEAEILGLTNTLFFQADAENTKLPDNSIDLVVCSGVLHHLDLSYTFPELRRILNTRGKVLAVEALNYNPFIKLYRFITPIMRTDWEKEHILSLKDVKFASHFFEIGKVNYWHITSYLCAFAPKLLPFANYIDKVLTKIPGIKLMAWMFTFELIKKKEH